jgi:phage shock protein A
MRDTLTTIMDLVSKFLRGNHTAASSLDRSIALATSDHFTARRALAIAVAEEAREIVRRDDLTTKVSDLEARAVQAIRAGRDDLAMNAAETIASIRTEIEASERASSRFTMEVALARREVDGQRRRLADLDRGRRLARIGSALNGAAALSDSGRDRLSEAENVLDKINAENDDARAVREEMAPGPDRLIERLSGQGFGPPVGVRATDVMARLRTMAMTPGLIASDR